MIRNRRDGIYYLLIMVTFYIFIIFLLVNSKVSLLEYLNISVALLLLTVGYFIPLIEGLILSLVVSVFYSGYMYWIMKIDNPWDWIVWSCSFIWAAFVSCMAGEWANERERLREDYEKSIGESVLEDPETGIGNITAFLLHFDREIAASKRYGHSLGVVAIQLKYLKELKELKGRGLYEKTLMKIAKTLQVLTRLDDELFKMEEGVFLLITTNTGSEEIKALQERIQNKLSVVDIEGEEFKFDLNITWKGWNNKILDAVQMKKAIERKMEYGF